MKTFDVENKRPGWEPTAHELDEWLRQQVLCALSSLDETGAPELATVAFSVTQNGGFVVGTSELSHKARNIKYDCRTAMVVTNPEQRYTAQIKGIAWHLSQTAFMALADEHYRQRPESLPFKDEPGQTHIILEPTVLRFSDCSVNPWLVTEFDEAEWRRR